MMCLSFLELPHHLRYRRAMKIFKFIFWVGVSLVMAYFLADIKIAGKTLKQNIDDFLASDAGREVKQKSQMILEKGLDKTSQLVNKAQTELAKDDAPAVDAVKAPTEKAEFSDTEEARLKKLLEKGE